MRLLDPARELFVVGDVHGCLHTFRRLLLHCRPQQQLVQLGDLIDRGRYSPECVAFARELEASCGAIFLKGNHEYEMLQYFRARPKYDWYGHCGKRTLAQYAACGRAVDSDLAWMDSRPLACRSDAIALSHAGFSRTAENPYDEHSDDGLLWNRRAVAHLGRLQVIGHTPQPGHQPRYDRDAHCWRIDTGACYGGALTAALVLPSGHVRELISIPVLPADLDS